MRSNFQGALSPTPPRAYAAPVIPQNVPCYRILKPCFLDDTMYFEGDIITWAEEPNSEMEPLNGLADDAVNAFYDKCEKLGKEASEKRGTLYVALHRPSSEKRSNATSESRRVEVIKGDGGVPVMGSRKRGRPPLAQKVDMGGVEQKPIANLAAKSLD